MRQKETLSQRSSKTRLKDRREIQIDSFEDTLHNAMRTGVNAVSCHVESKFLENRLIPNLERGKNLPK